MYPADLPGSVFVCNMFEPRYHSSMSEKFQFNPEAESKEGKKREYVAVAKELSERQEGYSFPGLDEGAYANLKATEEEGQGYITPIDDVIERFQAEGMKVVFGNDSDSGTVFVLPKNSDDVQGDSIHPRHLRITEDMGPELKKLIEMNQEMNQES